MARTMKCDEGGLWGGPTGSFLLLPGHRAAAGLPQASAGGVRGASSELPTSSGCRANAEPSPPIRRGRRRRSHWPSGAAAPWALRRGWRRRSHWPSGAAAPAQPEGAQKRLEASKPLALRRGWRRRSPWPSEARDVKARHGEAARPLLHALPHVRQHRALLDPLLKVLEQLAALCLHRLALLHHLHSRDREPGGTNGGRALGGGGAEGGRAEGCRPCSCWSHPQPRMCHSQGLGFSVSTHSTPQPSCS